MQNNKLTKSELVDRILRKTTTSRKEIQDIVEKTMQEIKATLAEGQVIELRGFGTFEIRNRKGRERARNPKTGEIVSVADHGVVIFRPGKELKQMAWPLVGK